MTRVLSYGVCEMMVSELAANAGKVSIKCDAIDNYKFT